jgi:hypothetical protein
MPAVHSLRSRLPYLAFGLALAALAAVVVLAYPEGREAVLPDPLEEVFPLPGDAVVRQTAVEVELPVGYSLEIFVDGRPVPATEIGHTPSTGVWIWQPAPGGSIEQWTAGEHTVRISWDRVAGGRPDPGEYEWSFRVQ